MDWKILSELKQIEQLSAESNLQPIVIFKHSTRCSISSVAKARLERAQQPAGISFYYLDLLQHRDISNLLAERYSVYHESPQVLLIKNGECIYDESHNGIDMNEIVDKALH
ncbi:MAG: bacillithiol system redox-active protein YtxJ [Bacteroidetes bacterium]|nr:bacillithiol system redox-active protein YtxJ [Bacteroidota bacterium]